MTTNIRKAPASEGGSVIDRAYAAHFRQAAREGTAAVTPAAGRLREAGGKRYVVLEDAGGGVLRVYRVRNDGMLKGLKRWPRELEEPR